MVGDSADDLVCRLLGIVGNEVVDDDWWWSIVLPGRWSWRQAQEVSRRRQKASREEGLWEDRLSPEQELREVPGKPASQKDAAIEWK